MKQQFLVFGVLRMQGTGKASGKPYDFCKINVARELQMQGPIQQCNGFEMDALDCEPVVLQKLLNARGLPSMVELSLQVGNGGKLRVVDVAIPARATA